MQTDFYTEQACGNHHQTQEVLDMKTVLFVTIVTYAFLSYSQPSGTATAGVVYDHHKMMAAHGCPASKASSTQSDKSWRYLKGDSSQINLMMIDWHDRGENSFGPIRNI
ncbi:MAG: hypothetical protein B6D76_14910 [gamma proteobacterium symbiont of Stewartia floridana]|nr:MAG: hypothetical protein B6D76_14910 [gamma proteobacterium symbiont of Stewartia floridana]